MFDSGPGIIAIINASHWQHTFTHYFSGSTACPQSSFDDAMNPDNWQQRYGAYAYVFIHHTNKDLLLIRDHFGCEPLYYYRDQTGFIFGSTLRNAGALSACAQTPNSGAPWGSVTNVWIATIDGGQYAYIADPANSRVYRCMVPANGALIASDCIITPSSSVPSWTPYGITTAYMIGG